MALNLEALGKTLGPVTKDYHWKDTVLYALGVGAGAARVVVGSAAVWDAAALAKIVGSVGGDRAPCDALEGAAGQG